jgi:hypothetical protein
LRADFAAACHGAAPPLRLMGNGQWDIPALRTLLEEVLSKNQEVTDYEVDHEFRDIGWAP